MSEKLESSTRNARSVAPSVCLQDLTFLLVRLRALQKMLALNNIILQNNSAGMWTDRQSPMSLMQMFLNSSHPTTSEISFILSQYFLGKSCIKINLREFELDCIIQEIVETYGPLCKEFPWLRKDATERIEEFTDICRMEKHFFESWNHHIIGIYSLHGAQVDLPLVCIMFTYTVIRQKKSIQTHQFLLHHHRYCLRC